MESSSREFLPQAISCLGKPTMSSIFFPSLGKERLGVSPFLAPLTSPHHHITQVAAENPPTTTRLCGICLLCFLFEISRCRQGPSSLCTLTRKAPANGKLFRFCANETKWSSAFTSLQRATSIQRPLLLLRPLSARATQC